MQIKSEFFSEIYVIDSPENLTDKQWDNLLVSGRMNWDKYFIPFKTKREHEVVKNVELLEFDTEDEMYAYLKIVNPIALLNYSVEHDKPCVLRLS